MCRERSPMSHEGSPAPPKCLFVSRKCSRTWRGHSFVSQKCVLEAGKPSRMTQERSGMCRGHSPVFGMGMGWGMSRPRLAIARRDSAAAEGRCDNDAFVGELLEDPVQVGAIG